MTNAPTHDHHVRVVAWFGHRVEVKLWSGVDPEWLTSHFAPDKYPTLEEAITAATQACTRDTYPRRVVDSSGTVLWVGRPDAH